MPGRMGLAPELLDFSLDAVSKRLNIDLRLEQTFSDDFKVNLDLATLASLAGIDLPSDFANLFDASGKAFRRL